MGGSTAIKADATYTRSRSISLNVLPAPMLQFTLLMACSCGDRRAVVKLNETLRWHFHAYMILPQRKVTSPRTGSQKGVGSCILFTSSQRQHFAGEQIWLRNPHTSERGRPGPGARMCYHVEMCEYLALKLAVYGRGPATPYAVAWKPFLKAQHCNCSVIAHSMYLQDGPRC